MALEGWNCGLVQVFQHLRPEIMFKEHPSVDRVERFIVRQYKMVRSQAVLGKGQKNWGWGGDLVQASEINYTPTRERSTIKVDT